MTFPTHISQEDRAEFYANLALSYSFPMCTQSKFSSSAIECSVSSVNFLIGGHTLILV